MDEVIRTEGLAKHFGNVHAVDGVSLKVGRGEIYGFLGLNGAGKTTTIRMLLGMIRPTAGSVHLHGENIGAEHADLWKRVGYLVETPSAYPELSVWENLEIIRHLRLVPEPASVDLIIDKLRLTAYRTRKAGTLSLGNAQRLGLAKALIHAPDVLILDEPANGLDPAGIVEIRGMLRQLASNQGVTIFISSHILEEISKLANRIGIIHEGKLVQELNTRELERLLNKRLIIDTVDNLKALSRLQDEKYSVRLTQNGLLATPDPKAISHPETIAMILVHAGLPPTMLKVEEENLESYFLRTIGVNPE